MPDIGATGDVEGTAGRADSLEVIENGRFWELSRMLVVVVHMFVVLVVLYDEGQRQMLERRFIGSGV
jgi:hypothetical protein